MDSDQLVEHANNLAARVMASENSSTAVLGVHAQVAEFLKTYSGPKSSFSIMAGACGGGIEYKKSCLAVTLRSFVEYIEAGLVEGVSPERKGQLDVVSDLLEQAHLLLENNKVHPAAPAVLIGATLDEFLRTWVEILGLSLGNKKPGMDAYTTTLKTANHITKQDVKDITAWAGTRNHAAHGEWDLVGDKKRVMLMLEGVNLFLRKYSS